MDVELLPTSDQRWDAILDGLHHDVYHRRAYLAAEDEHRGTLSKLFVLSEGRNLMAIPLAFRPVAEVSGLMDASSPYGYPAPLISEATDLNWVPAAIDTFLRELRAANVVSLFLRFHPLLGLQPSHFSSFGRVVEEGSTVAIKLARPFMDVRAEMRKGLRYDVRRALREGQVVLQDVDWRHFAEFLEIYSETMERVGAAADYFFPRAYFERLRDDLGALVSLWVTKIEGQVAAAALITECHGGVQYHLSGTASAHLASHPTKILLDGVAEWANGRGNGWFHLGGGLGGREDSLFHFKAGFSPLRRSFSTARIIVNPATYEDLTEAWAASAGGTIEPDGFFPAYRRPVNGSPSN